MAEVSAGVSSRSVRFTADTAPSPPPPPPPRANTDGTAIKGWETALCDSLKESSDGGGASAARPPGAGINAFKLAAQRVVEMQRVTNAIGARPGGTPALATRDVLGCLAGEAGRALPLLGRASLWWSVGGRPWPVSAQWADWWLVAVGCSSRP